MQRLIVFLALLILPALSFAAGDSGYGRFSIFGEYGLGTVNPSDINTIQRSFTPRPGDITSSTIYGGGIRYMFTPKFRFSAVYELMNAKNLNGSTGIELNSTLVWGNFDFMLIRSGAMFVYVGAGLGYPTYSHATATISGFKFEYDADKTLAYQGQGGLGFMLGKHVSLFFQGGYQSVVSGDVKTASGTALTVTGSTKAKIDMSGFKGVGGLALVF